MQNLFCKAFFYVVKFAATNEVYEKITLLEAWSIVEAILSWTHKMPSMYSTDVVKDLRRNLQVADRQIYNRRNKLAEIHKKYGFIKKPGPSKTLEWDFLQFFFNGSQLDAIRNEIIFNAIAFIYATGKSVFSFQAFQFCP